MADEMKASTVSETAAEEVSGGSGLWTQYANGPWSQVGDHILYTVAPGDTLSGIAYRFGVTADEIRSWNSIVNPNLLVIGSKLVIYPRIFR